MIFTDEELKLLADIPQEKKHELLQLARSLKAAHDKKMQDTEGKKRNKPRLWGALEGKVWISDDFNDPMDFVSPDEMRVLEAMRAEKKRAAHEEILQGVAV